MKLERIRISSEFLKSLDFSGFAEHVISIEILTTFQHDRNNFLSLARILFKKDHVSKWESILKETFLAEFLQLISKRGNEILCFMKSTSETGFFPMPENILGPWAILPPISIDGEFITANILADDKSLGTIHDALSSMDAEFKILALSDWVKTVDVQKSLKPAFTGRQEEIARYAFRNGFFETPKKITAEEISRHFGVSISAINEHLRKVKLRAMEYFFG